MRQKIERFVNAVSKIATTEKMKNNEKFMELQSKLHVAMDELERLTAESKTDISPERKKEIDNRIRALGTEMENLAKELHITINKGVL